MRRIALAFACLLTSQGAAQLSAQQLDTLAVNKIFEGYTANTPGCVLGIGDRGRVLYSRAYGRANLEYDVPLTPATIVEIGSVSKQFTAASILLLARRGVLTLEDDVRKWLPELPDFGERITLRMLANHTSGLRDQWGLLGLMNSGPGSAVHTPELILDLITRQRDLNFRPNDQYLYSNTGYTLLGLVVKRASGKSLAEFSRENIFEPLEMTHTQWRDDYTRIVKGRATAYSRTANGYRQDMPFTNVYGNGGLLTTVSDLVLWWEALEQDKLGAGFLAQLTTSGVLNSKHVIPYALGVSNGEYRGVRAITHSGATAGYRAYLVHYPETRNTIALLCNDGSANPVALAEDVADVLLAGRLAPVAPPPAIKAAADVDLGTFAGLYHNRETDETIRMAATDGRLVAGAVELVPIGPNAFRMLRRDVDVSVLRADGTLQLRYAATDVPFVTLTRVAEAKPDAAKLREYAGTYTSPELGVVYRVEPGDESLVVKRRLQADLTLLPTYTDAFSNFGSWVFTRDASGKVNGLLYSQGRVRRVRFEKTS